MCLFWQRRAELTDRVRLPRHTLQVSEAPPDNTKYSRKDEHFYIITKKREKRRKKTPRRTEVSFGKIHFDILRYFTVVLHASKCIRRRMKADKSTNEICKRG